VEQKPSDLIAKNKSSATYDNGIIHSLRATSRTFIFFVFWIYMNECMRERERGREREGERGADQVMNKTHVAAQ